jgi:GT2 family glycosyltransferase
MSRPAVAVVIPTYNRASRLPAIVAALERQTFPPDGVDVIIADDCSPDDTAAVASDLAARSPLALRVVRTPRNSGPAAARNLAWRSSAAPILAFLDDDCVPGPTWLEAGVAAFARDDVGIVQGRTLPDPSSPLDPSHPIRYKGVTQHIESLTKRYEACNIFYRRAVLEAVGGFDETIPFFGEDTIPAWAARRLGVGDRFAPGAIAFHDIRDRGLRWYVRWALLHRNFPLLIKRYPEMRREILWGRLFVWPRHAALLAAVAGAGLATAWPPALVLTAPFLARYAPWKMRRDDVVGSVTQVVFDVLAIGALVAGSARHRAPML